MSEKLPSYDELPEIDGLGVRHAWDVFGRDDVLGSINLVTPERVARSAALVRSGEIVPLDLPLNMPDPPLFGRQRYSHHVTALNRHEMDDHLDSFYPQGSTQWDALAHLRCREYGFWGGRTQDPTAGPNGLGIHNWAQHGIAGRGVLIDLAAWASSVDPGYDPLSPRAFTADDLQSAIGAERLESGDILCFRTGWVSAYRALDDAQRESYALAPKFAGLRADEDVARMIWNAHPAAVLCDNPAIEVVPGDPAVGSLHRRLLPTLGFALGEMFDFERLARTCDVAARRTFFFVAAPLNLPDGIGSPGNAVAIF
jgi:kynurenine formamidase